MNMKNLPREEFTLPVSSNDNKLLTLSRKIQNIHPTNFQQRIDSLIERSRIYLRNEKYVHYVLDIEEILRLIDGQSLGLKFEHLMLFNVGFLFEQVFERFPESLEYYTKSLKSRIESTTFLRKGIVYMKMENPEKATTCFENSVYLDETNLYGLYYVAFVKCFVLKKKWMKEIGKILNYVTKKSEMNEELKVAISCFESYVRSEGGKNPLEMKCAVFSNVRLVFMYFIDLKDAETIERLFVE